MRKMIETQHSTAEAEKMTEEKQASKRLPHGFGYILFRWEFLPTKKMWNAIILFLSTETVHDEQQKKKVQSHLRPMDDAIALMHICRPTFGALLLEPALCSVAFPCVCVGIASHCSLKHICLGCVFCAWILILVRLLFTKSNHFQLAAVLILFRTGVNNTCTFGRFMNEHRLRTNVHVALQWKICTLSRALFFGFFSSFLLLFPVSLFSFFLSLSRIVKECHCFHVDSTFLFFRSF